MFTVEMDHDEVTITVLDEGDNYEDVQYIIFDDIVYIRQWDEFLDKFNVIAMSPEMFDDFRAALNSSEGSYIVKK